jgi:hypothetical protein
MLEKLVVRTALLLLAMAAVLEAISRLQDRPALHLVARWFLVAGMFVAFVPMLAAVAFVTYEALFRRKQR